MFSVRMSFLVRFALSFVMPGLVPGIHAFLIAKSWMAGTSPAMTRCELQPQQLLRIPCENHLPFRLRNLQRIHRRNRIAQQIAPLVGIERCVAGEQALVGAE